LSIDHHHHWIIPKGCSINDAIGFIYAIINTVTGQTYYGRKQFVKFKRRRMLPDKSWRFYKGSSRLVHIDIERYGLDKFQFHIIATFSSKTGMALGESTAIICSGCLEEPEKYYNRSAPSIRGSLSLNRRDANEIQRIRRFINGRKKELREHARRHLETEGACSPDE